MVIGNRGPMIDFQIWPFVSEIFLWSNVIHRISIMCSRFPSIPDWHKGMMNEMSTCYPIHASFSHHITKIPYR